MEKNNSNEKLYYNDNLNRILSQYITYQKYGDFAVILKDIFHRRAYEFEFSNEHILDEVMNFVNNVQKVSFVPRGEMSFERAMGVYMPAEHEIRLNQDFFANCEITLPEEQFGEKMFETLTHEVYHGIGDRKSGTGLTYYNYLRGQWDGTALDEVFVETAANRASIARKPEDAEHYRSDTDGYPDITFATNLLAASVRTYRKRNFKSWYSK